MEPEQKEELVEVIGKLLADKTTVSVACMENGTTVVFIQFTYQQQIHFSASSCHSFEVETADMPMCSTGMKYSLCRLSKNLSLY